MAAFDLPRIVKELYSFLSHLKISQRFLVYNLARQIDRLAFPIPKAQQWFGSRIERWQLNGRINFVDVCIENHSMKKVLQIWMRPYIINSLWWKKTSDSNNFNIFRMCIYRKSVKLTKWWADQSFFYLSQKFNKCFIFKQMLYHLNEEVFL